MALRELCLHLTRQCNQKCQHCYYNSGPECNDHMPMDLAKDLLYQASKAGVERVTMQGGEPLLYRYLEELCIFSKELGLLVVIPTNGLLVDSTVIKWMKESIDIIFISIHGNENFHDTFVGRSGAYNKAIQAVKECQNSGIRLGVHSSVSDNNRKIIPELSRLLDQIGVPIHGILFQTEVGRGSNIKAMDLDKWDQFKEEMKMLQKDFRQTKIRFESMRISLLSYLKYQKKLCSCRGAEKDACFIDTEGWIYPCALAMNIPALRFGHISNKSVEDYFNEINWEWVADHSPFYRECEVCEYFIICHGGCMVRRFMGYKKLCKGKRYLPTCVLYPDIDVYEDIKCGRF